jgi:hypothetical protein
MWYKSISIFLFKGYLLIALKNYKSTFEKSGAKI